MRFALSLTATLLSTTAAFAEDILIRADIAEATVFLSGADVTRTASVTVPAGEHRLLIAMPDSAQADFLQVEGPDGLILGPPQALNGFALEEGILDTPEEAEARAAVEDAREAVVAAQDDITAADAAIRAAETQLAYLTALTRGGQDGVALPDDPALVPQFIATLGAETARVQAELQQAQIARRDLAEALTERQRDLAAAMDAFARMRPFGTNVDVVEVSLRAAEDVEGEISLNYLTFSAGWEPEYELHLDSETGALEVDRFVNVYTSGTARWQDVQMAFSTAQPTRQRTPRTLSPARVRLTDPQARSSGGFVAEEAEADLGIADLAAPAPVMVEAAPAQAELDVNGLSVTYNYNTPVTITASGRAVLPFDSLSLDSETEARAVPRLDQTAFLIATATNDSGEPILPGLARYYRDGALIGEDMLPLIAEGEETDLAFGPLDHLQLVWIDRSLAEGDRGVFVTSNTQAREIAFGVENTSGEAQSVRLLYATPFGEQEDLEVDLTLSPTPDERDVDDMRGVHAWMLEVAPGETEMVGMSVEFDWPEDQNLNWRP